MNNTKNKSPYIVVDGEQVFTADYVFEQMQAQGARIDRVKQNAITALIVSCAVLIMLIIR